MSDIYQQIGGKIRELRTTLKGKGISQEELAQALKTTANTVSRWETAGVGIDADFTARQRISRNFNIKMGSGIGRRSLQVNFARYPGM